MGKIRGLSWIVKANLRASMLSTLGLMLALILSTLVVVGTRSAEDLLLKESFKENDIFLTATPQFDLTQEISYDIVSSWNNSFVSQLSLYNLGNNLLLNDQTFIDWEYSFPGENSTWLNLSPLPFPILENLYKVSIINSKLPQNFNETILITLRDGKYSDSLGKTLYFSSNSSAIINGFPVRFWVNNTVTVSGVVFYEDLPYYLRDKFYFSTGSSPTNKIVLLTDPERFLDFVQHSIAKLDLPVRSAIAHFTISSPSLIIKFHYSFNFSQLNRGQTILLSSGIEMLSNALTEYPRNQTLFVSIGFQHNLSTFNNIISGIDQSVTLYLLLAFPMLLIALLTVNFSLEIINHNRAQAIEVLKTRGMKNRLIFLTLAIETLVLYFMAFVGAIILGIPLATLMSQSNQFLEFSGPMRVVTIQEIDLLPVFLLNLVFILFVFLKPVIIISKSKIVELRHRKKEKPFWQKQNLDLLLLILGVGVSLLGQPFLGTYLENPLVYRPVLPFVIVLFLLSPLFLLLGLVLLFARGTELALRKTSEFLWEKRGGLLSLVLKNLYSNNRLASNTGLVIGLATCFLVIFSIISVSLSVYEFNRIIYETGSDLSVTVRGREEIVQQIENISSIDGVVEISEAVSFTYSYPQNPSSSAGDLLEVNFIGIQPNSVEVLSLRDYYSGFNLSEQVLNLADSSVLVNNQLLDWTRNENELFVQFYNQTSRKPEVLLLDITGTYTYFPYFFDGKTHAVIGEMRYILNLAKDLVFDKSSLEHHLFIKITNHADPNSIADQIASLLKIDLAQINSKSSLLENYCTSIITLLFWMNVNSIVFAAVVAIALTILLYTSTRIIVQSEENGLNRALGLKPRQNFQLRNLEVLTILIVAVLFGSLIGYLIARSLIVATSFFFVPPIFLVIPWSQLSFLFLIIIGVSISFNLILLAYFRRIEITQLLRAI